MLWVGSSYTSTKFYLDYSLLLKLLFCFLRRRRRCPYEACFNCNGTRLVKNQKAFISCILCSLQIFMRVSSSPTMIQLLLLVLRQERKVGIPRLEFKYFVCPVTSTEYTSPNLSLTKVNPLLLCVNPQSFLLKMDEERGLGLLVVLAFRFALSQMEIDF